MLFQIASTNLPRTRKTPCSGLVGARCGVVLAMRFELFVECKTEVAMQLIAGRLVKDRAKHGRSGGVPGDCFWSRSVYFWKCIIAVCRTPCVMQVRDVVLHKPISDNVRAVWPVSRGMMRR